MIVSLLEGGFEFLVSEFSYRVGKAFDPAKFLTYVKRTSCDLAFPSLMGFDAVLANCASVDVDDE